MHWNDGRRVVELGVSAKGLQACSDCKQPLQLTDVVNEKRYGLASILNVLCCCGQIKTISWLAPGSVDLRHQHLTRDRYISQFYLISFCLPVQFTINFLQFETILSWIVRLVLTCELNVHVWIQFLGMLHAGIGETHINNLLAAINVPVIHHKTLKRREREAGQGIEKLSKRSFSEALNEELERSRKR